MKELKCCKLCPRKCQIDRSKETGFCKANDKMKIARADLHYFEEPIISGTNGSGTIFFTYCNMRCIFCQNYEITTSNKIGKEVSIDYFSKICLNLQNKKAHNINLVTPTFYAPLIKEGILKAKKNGLKIPVVYNTSSYESVATIKLMNDVVDIYLADLKFYDDNLSLKYANTKEYFKYATKAINEMYKQVPKIIIKDNIMQKGLIVRVLLLPGELKDAKKIIKYLYDTYKDNIIISIMNQYTPVLKLPYENLNRCASKKEYESLLSYAINLGITNAFIQEGETQKKSFIPNFHNQKF